MTINEVAPPGFGHTKGDKKKGVKRGGTAAAFDRARKEGRFKGSKSDMFAIMWSQKKKGDKPHYKPGTDKKYKKYEEDWKPEIEHSKLGDAVKKKAEKKRKEAADSLPPHLKLDVMKKAFAKANEEVELDEGGMARQVKHSKSRSTAVLTANRGDKSSKENKARNKELGKKIRSMGYGYKKVKGEYPEKDEKTGKKKTVSEPSMAVNAPKKKFKKFKKQMKRLGKEYNQDAVITKKGKDKATLHPTTKRGRKTSTGVSRKGSK